MLQDIREHFIGTTGKVVLAVILLLLAGTGLNYTITPKSYVAKVDGEEVPLRQVQAAYEQQLQRFGDQDLPQQLLLQLQSLAVDQVITQTALKHYLEDAGYAISNAQVAAIIRDVEAFKQDGRFDPELYRRLLAQNRLTPAGFEADQRQQMLTAQLQANISASAFVTPEEFRRIIELSNEQRRVEYATLSADSFIDEVTVSDADVASWYESNPTRFQTQASAVLEYVMVDDALARQRIMPDGEALRAYYTSISDQYAGEEQRRASHVLLRTDEDAIAARELANSLLARLQAGEPLEDIARTYSNDGGSAKAGGDLGWVSRGVFVGPVEDAIFSMRPGELSGVVESSFGLHIIRLDDVRTGDAPTFEEVADDVRERYIAEREAAELLTLKEELADQLFESSSLAEIGTALGLEVNTVADFNEQSALPFGSSDEVASLVFGDNGLAEGAISDVIELDGGASTIIRVVQRTPAGRQPLEAVAGQIREELRQQAAEAIAAERGAQLASALRSDPGMRFETLVVNSNAELTAPKAIGRRDPETPAALAAAVFEATPGADSPHVGTVRAPGTGFIIYRVTEIIPGDAGDIPPEQLEAARRQLALRDGSAELLALTTAIRNEAKVKMGNALEQAENPGF